jgi:hypothetical protein
MLGYAEQQAHNDQAETIQMTILSPRVARGWDGASGSEAIAENM